uniref:RNase III domain-containing protein n=1 Tax=Anopheles coluzzii TaxID=1518534 RepID=A0A8W7P1K5_ANOCL
MMLFSVTRSLLRGAQRFDIHRNRDVHRWVAPTLRELRRRREKMGPEAALPRSSHSDWNYSAEIFAFGKRLQESFDANVLQQAFTHQSFIEQETRKQAAVGIEQPVLGVHDNRELIAQGDQLVAEYVEAFLLTALPRLPRQFIASVREALTSEAQLAHICLLVFRLAVIFRVRFLATTVITGIIERVLPQSQHFVHFLLLPFQ